MVEAARVSTDSSAHQFSTGYCAASVWRMMPLHLAGLGAQPHEALDQVDVAQRVAGAAGELAVILLDLRLQPVGLADHEGVGDGEEEDQHDQQQRRAASS